MDARRVLLGVSAIVFAASAAMTIVRSASMSAMGTMEMAGGWAMSHMWMLSPTQTLLGATASFIAMWVVMMVAMMLPSLTPTLVRYRQTIGAMGDRRGGRSTALVAAGYFFVWAVPGAIAFPLGVALARLGMHEPALARLTPIGIGVVVVFAGVLQCTGWKARHLAMCRDAARRGGVPSTNLGTGWRHGLRLGFHCVHSCVGLTAVLLVAGVMDLRVMIAVAAGITTERLAPNGPRAARAIGVIVVVAGLLLIVRR